jgi:adenosylmethionine-8-amino-7-oxononanoate aminotransferase
MGGRRQWQEMYGPLLLPFPHIEPCYEYRCALCDGECTLRCAAELEAAIVREGSDTVAAFIADPLVGATLAAAMPPPGYFEAIRDICDRHDVLFIADEVLTGFGRTGRGFAIEHWDVCPDIIACGKGISGGYAPLGAALVGEEVAHVLHDGSGVIFHGHTYGNNPFTCAVGLAVQRYMDEHRLIERSAEIGAYLHLAASRLRQLPWVGDVRGTGLLLGVELVEDKDARRPFPRTIKFAETVLEAALDVGITLYPGTGGARGDSGDAFIIAPPLIISEQQVDEVVDLLDASIRLAAERALGAGAAPAGVAASANQPAATAPRK